MGAGGSQELSRQDIAEIRRSTRFTEKEIREWYDKFHEDFPEGIITKRAFSIMYQKMFPHGNAADFADHVFRAYDVNGNGSIDFHEFMCTLNVASKGTVEEKLRWSFQLYDLDKDGTVSRDEATEIISAIYKMRGERNSGDKAEQTVERLFLQLDKDKDDTLTEVEFVMAAKNSRGIMKLLTGD